MKSNLKWTYTIPERDSERPPINAIVFKPDGSQMIVAVGNKVLVMDPTSGDIMQSLKAHKETVYSVDYAKDGKRFASGDASGMVVIWSSNAEGLLKYVHNEGIQCLAFNPVTQQLASCTADDIGIWSPDQKSILKNKTSAKVLCCSWTNDGQHIALGQYNGTISIRNRNGEEKLTIKRSAPIWTLSWNPSTEEAYETLAVGCWDQTLSFYHLSGKQIGKDKALGFDPCSVSYFLNGEYLTVAGSDRKVTLYTKDGIRLSTVAEKDDWVWTAKQRPRDNFVVLGTNNGVLSMHQLIFHTVHGLYQEQYAFRENMTDVVVHNLATDNKLKIRCRNYVKMIAIHKDRLAVQLPDRIQIYELYYDDAYELQYRLRERIDKKLECSLLVVTSTNVILCHDSKLQMYNFIGSKEREWDVGAAIRYIKVIGGPVQREALLVGLKNGSVQKIFIDNPFPIQLLKINNTIRCLDLSSSRTKLAVVDEQSNCLVYDLKTKEFLFQDNGANSVAWNTDYENMLCFSGNGVLSIKTGNFPLYVQRMQGFVVGFKGYKVFCLHYGQMNTIDIPQSASMYRYLEKKDYENAYKIACLGVTDNDWRFLGAQSLQALKFDIARKAFIRVRDVRYLELLSKIEQQQRVSTQDDQLFLADILAYQGKFQEAAELYSKLGHAEKAVDMFADLRKWTEAKTFANATSDPNKVKDLILRQAIIAEDMGDIKAASEMYVAVGEYAKAITIMGEHGWYDQLIEVCRMLASTDTKMLSTCAAYFRKGGSHNYAKEVYIKINDFGSLITLYVETRKWDDAFRLIEEHPELGPQLYLPYAEYLALNDRFDEAQQTLQKANRPEQALKMMQQLSYNAVLEHRFDDAAHYLWQLAIESLRAIQNHNELESDVITGQMKFQKYFRMAKLYYAYDFIHKYSEMPFSSMDPMYLFNIARYLLMNFYNEIPHEISLLNIVLTLAKLSRKMSAFKLARTAYDKLQTLVIPRHLTDQIDLAHLSLNSKPFVDNEDLVPICYRCSSSNPLINKSNGYQPSDFCATCLHPFVRSFHSFEVLPLVEFVLEDITDEDLQKHLASEASIKRRKKPDADNWHEKNENGAQTLTLNDNDFGGGDDDEDLALLSVNDPFSKQLVNIESVSGVYTPVKIDAETLPLLCRDDVYIQRLPTLTPKYYRCMVPEVKIAQCKECTMFFHEEDLQYCVINTGGCPFCKATLSPNDI